MKILYTHTMSKHTCIECVGGGLCRHDAVTAHLAATTSSLKDFDPLAGVCGGRGGVGSTAEGPTSRTVLRPASAVDTGWDSRANLRARDMRSDTVAPHRDDRGDAPRGDARVVSAVAVAVAVAARQKRGMAPSLRERVYARVQ